MTGRLVDARARMTPTAQLWLIFADGAIATAAQYHVMRVFRLEWCCRGELLSLLLWAAQGELFANTIVSAPASDRACVALGQGR